MPNIELSQEQVRSLMVLLASMAGLEVPEDTVGQGAQVDVDLVHVLTVAQAGMAEHGTGYAGAVLSIADALSAAGNGDAPATKLLADIGDYLEDLAAASYASKFDALNWSGFFSAALNHAKHYEAEEGRADTLTAGEFCRCIAHGISKKLTNEANYIKGPSGDPRCARFGRILGDAAGFFFGFASYLGCRRAPRIPLGGGDDIDGDSPWSWVGGR